MEINLFVGELYKYIITMNKFTQFKRLSDICAKRHLRKATFAQSDISADDICAK